MQKLGMKPVPGVSRVHIRKSKNVSGAPQQAAEQQTAGQAAGRALRRAGLRQRWCLPRHCRWWDGASCRQDRPRTAHPLAAPLAPAAPPKSCPPSQCHASSVTRWPLPSLPFAPLLFRQVVFTIVAPDVFKSPNSDTYVIFGEAKVEDPMAQVRGR